MRIPFLLFLTPSLPFSTTTSSPSRPKSTTTSSSSSSLSERINGEPREQRRKEGQTGWNHSLPQEDSPFWGEPETDTTTNTNANKLRTGWLHNTESPSEKEEQQQFNKPPTTNKARQTLELAMKQQRRQHQILQPPTFHATQNGIAMVTEHSLRVPLDYSDKSNNLIQVAFTIVETVSDSQEYQFLQNETEPRKRAAIYVQHAAMKDADPMLVYLQGGPGFGAPTPVAGLSLSSSWLGAALAKYKRIVLMDQRGTGKSTPVTKQSLELLFPDYFESNDNPARESSTTTTTHITEYLMQFRADHIVQDAEDIRDALLLPTDDDTSPRPWGASLGQSYGGFCTLTYLSQTNVHPPRVCLLTGGIPPVLTATDDVYASLWQRVRQRSLLYYDMYPGDVKLVKRLVRALLTKPVPLPSGGVLTARRLLQLGLNLGGSPSAFASLHALLQSAVLSNNMEDDSIVWNRAFLKQMEMEQSFDDHPIYYWLHESIYADGQGATQWSAHRQYEALKTTQPEIWDYERTCQDSSVSPVLFFGEMVFPWMSEDYGELQGMGPVAEALAQKEDWKPLYNMDRVQQVLSSPQQTRLAASVYYDDMFVDFKACEIMLQGPLSQGKAWITNDYQHSGLRDDGATIFNKLYGMAKGTIRTPS